VLLLVPQAGREIASRTSTIDASAPKRSANTVNAGPRLHRFLECAPAGGQIERLDLTMPVGLPEDGSHDEASIAQRGIQAAGSLALPRWSQHLIARDVPPVKFKVRF
jgi:hypothetical protein